MTVYYVADTYQGNATITNGDSYAVAMRTCRWFNASHRMNNGDDNRFFVTSKFIKNTSL